MISLEPIGVVKSSRTGLDDDYWGGIVSEIVIEGEMGAESLIGIEDFSHAEVIFYFHEVEEGKVVNGARHPRGDTRWPKVGILAQRAKARPNRLGLSIVKIVERSRNVQRVTGLDAIDGTPVLDIKPVMHEFLPRE